MIQCFLQNGCKRWFSDQLPQLISASKIASAFSIHPRIMHKHPDFLELLYVRSGSGVYVLDEHRYNIGPGDVVICNADCLHDEDSSCTKDLSMLSIAVSNVQLRGLPPNHLIAPAYSPVFSTGADADNISSLMLMIYTMLVTDPDLAAEVCQHLTTALLSRLLTIIQQHCKATGNTLRSRTDIIADEVKQYINTHFTEQFTLNDIAQTIDVSPYHLAHIFKEQTGYSPMQYTMRRRLGEAQNLLISTRLPVAQIASAVGFGNSCHFNTMFSKYIGMPPNKYRSQYVRQDNSSAAVSADAKASS